MAGRQPIAHRADVGVPRLRQEDGFALLLALGVTIVLSILVTSMISYTSSGTRSVATSGGQLSAADNAESAANGAVSFLAAKLAAGGDPSAANLLGCAGATGVNDTNGPSNCAAPTPKLICLPGNTSCTTGAAGTASLYGYYSGTNGGTYLSQTVPASTWLLVSTGYANNPATGGVVAHTSLAEIKVNPMSAGAVAALWNHVFLTAPLVPNVCQTDFSSNNLIIDVPLYVLGNLCFSGNNNVVKEVGQPVDLQVGGKLSINGSNGNSVGVSAGTPITSGVVVGGCTNGSVSSATTSCTSGSYKYWVTTADTYTSQSAPTQSASDIQLDYNGFDPGPKHPCQAGTTPPPLAATVFDNNTTYNNSAGSFELTPASSYSCISQNGASVGQLTWDNTAKKLTINGSIFIDGSMTVSQSAYYVGTAIIEVAGTIVINGNSTTLCATSPCSTGSTAWQGTSGNNSMLTLAPLATGTSLTMSGNTETFQGSVWTQPTSTVSLGGNNETIEGPMSMGTVDTPSNNASLKPFPVIKNMPVGAPVPPNVGVSLGTVSFIRN
jgi:Tfp pilus assembly protein PilX